MKNTRKSFVYLKTKVYGGKSENKTLGIKFYPEDRNLAVSLARGILQAVEYGNGVDITVFKSDPLKSGLTKITVTAPI